MKYILRSLMGCLFIVMTACEKDTMAEIFAPQVNTGTASNVYRKGATLSGSVNIKGTTVVDRYGILLSEFQSMAEYEEIPLDSNERDFSVSLDGLDPGKTYYYCAYVYSGYSMLCGTVRSFTTLESSAPIFNAPIVSVVAGSSVRLISTLLDDGGSELTLSGFCYNEIGNPAPVFTDKIENVTLENNAIETTIEGLSPGKTYQIRAYAISNNGLGYSEMITVTTGDIVVEILSAVGRKNDHSYSLALSANISDSGSTSVSDIGFCYSTSNQWPTIDDGCISLGTKSQDFSAVIENLSLGTTYYVRAYAVGQSGMGYSQKLTYTVGETAMADVANLCSGIDFNMQIKQLANGNAMGELDADSIIGRIEFVSGVPLLLEGYVDVSSKDSPVPVYTTFNQKDSTLTIVSSAERVEIENARWLFSELTSLRSIDLGNFKVSNSTVRMDNMFGGCSSLSSLDVSTWDTGNVADMDWTFAGCSSLSSLDVSSWDTGNVTSMIELFDGCSSLSSLDVSSWDTGNVTNMWGLFRGCSSLSSLDVSSWDTGNVTSMWMLFGGCSSLSSLDVSSWDTGNVTDMRMLFYYCSSLSSLDVSSWNTGNVTDMLGLFEGCSSLSSLDIFGWTLCDGIDCTGMFSGCANQSESCNITATPENQAFLLDRKETTGMEVDYFTWTNAK